METFQESIFRNSGSVGGRLFFDESYGENGRGPRLHLVVRYCHCEEWFHPMNRWPFNFDSRGGTADWDIPEEGIE
jgi:hypothetical protein